MRSPRLFAVLVVFLAVFPSALLASSESAAATSGPVHCKKLYQDKGPYAFIHITECSDPANTGGSGYFTPTNLFGGTTTVHWKTGNRNTSWIGGKTTVFKIVTVQEEIGACPPGGPGYDSYQVYGYVMVDHTGSISGRVYGNLCTGNSGVYGVQDFVV